MNPHCHARRRAGVCTIAVACVALLTVAARAGTSAAGAPYPGHSYELVVAHDVDWAQANADATKMGGWLVTIDSISEQEFVQNILLAQSAPPGAYWFGLEKSKTGQYVWSSKSQPDVFTHWAPHQPDNRGGNEGYGSILWDGPTGPASVRARNGFWNDLPLNGYKKGLPDVTTDLVEAGYIVEFVGNHKGAVPIYAKSAAVAATPAVASTGGTVSGVPLPSAALLFPLGLVMAVYAGRRMKNRPN